MNVHIPGADGNQGSVTSPRAVSLSSLPVWVGIALWALMTGLGAVFLGMTKRSMSFACERVSADTMTCDVSQRVGFEERHDGFQIGPNSEMRVLPVLTSDDTPNTVALQIFPLGGAPFQSVPSEDRSMLDGVLDHLEACRASAAPHCDYRVDRDGPLGRLLGWPFVVGGFLAGLACLVRTRVAIVGERLRVQRTLFGVPIHTRLDIARDDWASVELERDDSGDNPVGRIVLRRKAATNEEGRFVLFTSSLRKASDGVLALKRLR